ncbi:hypothetical protein ACIQTN_29785 [Streptomyces werraensis]|uniref:hypothetical protein n=1 Tax=Streptomyces werraensis TaxID=68284 RepID=UPI00381F6691
MTDAQTLQGLLGEWVTVRNPDLPGTWYGRLIGLHDDPGVLLAIPGRGATCLPQRFTVTPAEPPAVPPAAHCLPDGALDSAAAGADMLDAWAQTPAGRNYLAHALTQLARDGWLRREPGDAWDPVPDTPPDTPPDTSGHAVQGMVVHHHGQPFTSTDTVRTHPGTDTPDTSDPGVRIEYRARVRRGQVHQAIAEAFDVISRETDR